MATMRQVRRQRVLPASPSRVWVAVTAPAQLSRWLGIDLRGALEPGAAGTARDVVPGVDRRVRVEAVESPTRLVFSWWPGDADPASGSLVELTLDEDPDGTRITVRETALADLGSGAGEAAGAGIGAEGGR